MTGFLAAAVTGEAAGAAEASGAAAGTGAWGGEAAAGEGEGESLETGDMKVGNGHTLTLDPEFWYKLLHHPIGVAAITERAQAICDAANSMAVVKGAQYVVSVQNRSDSKRARARVRPGGNFPILGEIDEAAHATLLKAMDMFPGDPVPTFEAPETDSGDESESSGPQGDAEGAGGEAGGEAAAGEAADIAIVAL